MTTYKAGGNPRGATTVTPITTYKARGYRHGATITEPPPRTEAEQSVLGGLMLDNTAWLEVSRILAADDFYHPQHRLIYDVINQLAEEGKPFDIVILGEQLESAGLLVEAGGLQYLGIIARDTPSAANIRSYVEIVRKDSLRRQRLVAISRDDHDRAATITATINAFDAGVTTGLHDLAVVLMNGSDIEPKPIRWLWREWIALGKLHILAGLPGVGKSTLALAIAATITRGGRWPDGSISPLGRVLIWSSEDDPEDTLIPRLMANGADRKRIDLIHATVDRQGKRPFDPSQDLPYLKQVITAEHNFLIIDSVADAIAGDSHKNAEVRRGLMPIKDLASEKNLAVLGIAHFKKDVDGPVMLRIVGSIGFSGLARLAMVACKHREHGYMLMRAKSNIGPDEGGYAYDIHQDSLDGYPDIQASHILWGDVIKGTADDLLNAELPARRHATDEAEEFLKDLLVNGPVPQGTIEEKAREQGYAMRTVHRAKKDLGIISKRRDGLWFWGYNFDLHS